MRKFLLIYCLLITFSAQADIFSDLLACIMNPCSCGLSGSDKYHVEIWGKDKNGDPIVHTYDKGMWCPPYNKIEGREGCLKGAALPGHLETYYNYYCVEKAADSTFQNPRIRVRIQMCNVGCWTHTKTLSWAGECVVYEGPYLYPTTRLCARVAMPEYGVRGTADYQQADHGYSQYMGHRDVTDQVMNEEGDLIATSKLHDESGNILPDSNITRRPKVCVYLDYASWDLFAGRLDLLDIMPDSQPLHYNPGLSPMVQLIVAILKFGSEMWKMLPNLLLKFARAIPGIDVFGTVLDVIYFLINWEVSTVIWVLESVGKLNNSVAPDAVGCVEIPMGEIPPAYMDIATAIPLSLVVYPICPPGVSASSAKGGIKCAKSSAINDYLNNALRIGYNKYIPVCKNGEDPKNDDSCVTFYGQNISATVLHNTLTNDIIPRCDSFSPTGDKLCVKYKHPLECHASGDRKVLDCSAGFRVLYATKNGNQLSEPRYYYDTNPALEDCRASSAPTENLQCQTIYGVNVGEFQDVQLKFPDKETSYSVDELYSVGTMTTSGGHVDRFKVSLVRHDTLDPISGHNQSPSEICVYEIVSDSNSVNQGAGRLIGCASRAPQPTPIAYQCGTQTFPNSTERLPVSCQSTMHEPRIVVGLKTNSASTYGTVGVTRLSSSGSLVEEGSKINLAGSVFTAIGTDDLLTQAPFSGPSAYSTGVLFGSYKDDIYPLSTSSSGVETKNSNAVYLRGLAYKNKGYYGGATKVCLSDLQAKSCVNDKTRCVLARLAHSDYTDCKKFNKEIRQTYPGLKLCDASHKNCPVKETINGGKQIKITRCSDNTYCYTYDGVSKLSDEICVPSIKLSDREYPYQSLGIKLAQDQYYDMHKVDDDTSSVFSKVITAYDQQKAAYKSVEAAWLIRANIANTIAKLPPNQPLPEQLKVDVENADKALLASRNWPLSPVPASGTNKQYDAMLAEKAAEKAMQEQKVFVTDEVQKAYDDQYTAYLRQKDIVNAETYKVASDAQDKADKSIKAMNDKRTATLADNIKLPFNEALYGLRDKTAMEEGLCADVPQPGCAATGLSGFVQNGFSTWTSALYGQLSSGTCYMGFIPKFGDRKSLKRYCLYDHDTGKVAFEPAGDKLGCQVAPSCDAVAVGGKETGYASWSSALYDDFSTGKCRAAYTPINSTSMRRRCMVDTKTGLGVLEPVQGNIGCKYSPRACYVKFYVDPLNGVPEIRKLIAIQVDSKNDVYNNRVYNADYTTDGRRRVVFGTDQANKYNIANGIYELLVTIKVGSKDHLKELQLEAISFDDEVKFTLNDRDLWMSKNFYYLSQITDRGGSTPITDINIDMLPYIKDGGEPNNLKIKLGVAGSGRVYFSIISTLKCDEAQE